MTDTDAESLSVVVERDLSHPPEKVWRALTQPHLLRDWLMQADFQPILGHVFSFRAEWGSVDCQVTEIEPLRSLAYRWAGLGLDSVVTWTLTPIASGTRLRMEQTGFTPEQRQAHAGATAGWPRFLGKLEQVLAGID